MFSPKLVLSYLLKEFGSCDILRKPTRTEQKLIDKFASILREASNAELDIDSEEDDVVEDFDNEEKEWSGDDEDERNAASGTGSFLFGDVAVSKELVEKAIAHYRSSDKGNRSLSSMTARFRFIRTPYHLVKLREIERERNLHADRLVLLKRLAERLKDLVIAKFASGIALHDHDIRDFALKMNLEEFHISNFRASHRWIQRFKNRYGIVSRRITTFISKKSLIEKERIDNSARLFVTEVKKEMELWPLNSICNADQSGFVKEIHSARSLAERGARKVERIVQSVPATTHSFTVMPTLYADGHLGAKLFVVMQERQGNFPTRGHFRADNLEIRANSTHMMNKELLLDWIRTCVAAPESPSSTLLLVDSWSSFKDHRAILSALPSGKSMKIMNIPAGTTSQIQPLDVYFFLPFKSMYKRFVSFVLTHEIEFPVHQRDSILKILSLIYFQFCSPRFKNFLSYPWHAAGYVDSHPGSFETPSQVCFPYDMSSANGCEEDSCNNIIFIRCARCEKYFCFHHFVVAYHTCT